jgi:inorganic pyrophosphatase/exopolyphosphatase
MNCFKFVCGKSYPFKYPYTYGPSFIKINPSSVELYESQYVEEHKQNFEMLYEKYLENKKLEEVCMIIKDEIERDLTINKKIL